MFCFFLFFVYFFQKLFTLSFALDRKPCKQYKQNLCVWVGDFRKVAVYVCVGGRQGDKAARGFPGVTGRNVADTLNMLKHIVLDPHRPTSTSKKESQMNLFFWASGVRNTKTKQIINGQDNPVRKRQHYLPNNMHVWFAQIINTLYGIRSKSCSPSLTVFSELQWFYALKPKPLKEFATRSHEKHP